MISDLNFTPFLLYSFILTYSLSISPPLYIPLLRRGYGVVSRSISYSIDYNGSFQPSFTVLFTIALKVISPIFLTPPPYVVERSRVKEGIIL